MHQQYGTLAVPPTHPAVLSLMQALLYNLLDPVKNEEMWSSLFKNSLEFHDGNSKALSQA